MVVIVVVVVVAAAVVVVVVVVVVIHFAKKDCDREYMKTPRMAMVDPILPFKVSGLWKMSTEERMITMRLKVLASACVTGLTLFNTRKDSSL